MYSYNFGFIEKDNDNTYLVNHQIFIERGFLTEQDAQNFLDSLGRIDKRIK